MVRAAGAMLVLIALAMPMSHAGETVDDLQAGVWFFCRSNYAIGTAFYFSTTQLLAHATTRGELQESFIEYMRSKYRYPHESSVSCVFAPGGDLQARTESSRLQTIDNLHQANYEVVVTDWQYAN